MLLIIKHTEKEGPGSLENFFRKIGWDIKIVELEKGETFPSLQNCKTIVSLGGPMNVYEEDKYPFLKEESEFLKKAIEKEIPVLGICLGAQLLAKVCGAEVKKAPQREIGWYKVKLTKEGRDDSIFQNSPQEFSVFQWHEDTFDIPKGAVLLAEGELCPNQAFRFGKNAYGFQFHIEVTTEMIELWVNEHLKDYPNDIDEEKIIRDTIERKGTFNVRANLIYDNWKKII